MGQREILKKVTPENFSEVILQNLLSDKTKVGWWKMDTLIFHKVLNAQTGLESTLKLMENLDINTCTE
jgi:hypothetical protein